MLLSPTLRLGLLLSALLCVGSIVAQEGRTASALPAKQGINPAKVASPCFDAPDSATSRQHENDAIARLPKIPRFWLTEDVAFIISREERCAFLHLATVEERDQFIEQFWSRRARYLIRFVHNVDCRRDSHDGCEASWTLSVVIPDKRQCSIGGRSCARSIKPPMWIQGSDNAARRYSTSELYSIPPRRITGEHR